MNSGGCEVIINLKKSWATRHQRVLSGGHAAARVGSMSRVHGQFELYRPTQFAAAVDALESVAAGPVVPFPTNGGNEAES